MNQQRLNQILGYKSATYKNQLQLAPVFNYQQPIINSLEHTTHSSQKINYQIHK